MMNQLAQDDLDADLYEIECVAAQIKKIMNGEIDLKALEGKENQIKKRKEQEQLKKEIKQREYEQKLLKGRQGKGEGQAYHFFCMKCFIEYSVPNLTQCTNCNGPLITKDERHKDLKIKVEALKGEQKKKKYRRMKYENWLKSQGMIHVSIDRQGPTNYSKWDLYESESDEEEKEPILPRHDPQFLALEKQLNDDMKRREESKKKANRLKEEGNVKLKEKDYGNAIANYTNAINEDRSIMSIYTNRAFAYMKTEEWKLAVEDCQRVTEYYELFEEELKKNVDLYLKALMRMAVSYGKMKNYPEAKEALEKAKEYALDNKEIKELEGSIDKEAKLYQQSLEAMHIEKDESGKVVEELLLALRQIAKDDNNDNSNSNNGSATNGNLNQLCEKVIKIMDERNKSNPNEDNNYILFFTISGGLDLLFTLLLSNNNTNKRQYRTSILKLIRVISDKYMSLINEQKGFNKLILFLFNSNQSNTATKTKAKVKGKTQEAITLEQANIILELLEKASLIEDIRKKISEIPQLDQMTSQFLTQYNITTVSDNKTANILSKAFTFICNICYSSEDLRSKISNQVSIELFKQLETYPTKYNLELDYHRNLLESILSFITNLSCDIPFRTSLSTQTTFLKFLSSILLIQLIKNELQLGKVDDIYEKIASLFYNLTFIPNKEKETIASFIDIHIETFIVYYILHVFTISNKDTHIPLLRSVMLLFRIVKYNPTVFNKSFPDKEEMVDALISFLNVKYFSINSGIIDYSIKLFAFLMKENDNGIDFNKGKRYAKLIAQCNDVLIENCAMDLSKISQLNNERIVNLLSLMITMVGKYGESAGKETKPIIPMIIAICKDKTDLIRKNSAVLLAKIAKSSQEMEDYVRDLHGMDVLVNVTKFLNI